MRKTLIILTFSIFETFAFSVSAQNANTTACLKAASIMEKGLYDELRIQKRATFSQDFASWFFSDAFEREVKSGRLKGGISVPFADDLISFSAEGSSSSAWETWHENKGSTKWHLDQATYESVYQRVSRPDAQEVYLRTVKICMGGASRVSGDLRAEENSATGNFYYIQQTGESVPIITGFVCGDGFDCKEANRLWKGHRLNTAGSAVVFTWLPGATSGSVTMNTTRGSVELKALRPVKPVSVKIKYTANQTIVEKIGDLATAAGTPNMDDKGANEGYCNIDPDHCSGDKKFLAAVTVVEVNVPPTHPNNELRNARFDCTGGNCGGWYEVLSKNYFRNSTPVNSGGTTFRGRVKNWSTPATWTVTAEEWGPVDHPYPVVKESALNGRSLDFSIPKTSVASATMLYSKRGTPMEVPVGQKLGDDDVLEFKSVTDLGMELQYHYETKL